MERLENINSAVGKTYYVSANGVGDGLSEENPMSFAQAHTLTYGPGDCLRMRRGDVFYGSVSLKVGAQPDNPFELCAYGSGCRPVVSLAKIIDSPWERHSEVFYRFDLSEKGQYEGLRDDNDDVGFMEDVSGAKWGVRKENETACNAQWDFYCNNGFIYVKTEIDPCRELGRLTLAVDGNAVRVASSMKVHDLHIRYSAGHGINLQRAGVENVHIYDCVIEDIGGGRLGTTGWTKYGNGIEFFGGASNMTVERNIIRNTYDVGFTLQGGDMCEWHNVVVKNNIFAFNTQSFETWTSFDEPDMGIHNWQFVGNVCICQGEGWGTPARPDKIGGAGQVKMCDVLVYGYKAPVLDITISRNIFYNPNSNNRTYSISSTGSCFIEKVRTDHNLIFLPDQTSVCFSTDLTDNNPYGGQNLTFQEWQERYGHDQHSTFTAIDPDRGKYNQMEEVAHVSYDFDEIICVVKDSGILFER